MEKSEIWKNILDNCFVINEKIKIKLKNNYRKNRTMKYYFKECFENFDEEEQKKVFGIIEFKNMDIKSVIEKLLFLSVTFELNKKKEILINFYYNLSNESGFGKSNILGIIMDERSEIKKIEHGLILLD